MLQLFIIIGLGAAFMAFVSDTDDDEQVDHEGDEFDSDSDASPDTPEGSTNTIESHILGTASDDILTAAPKGFFENPSATEDLSDRVDDFPQTVDGMSGNDKIEIGNGDHAIGGEGHDEFSVNFDFENLLGAAVVEDFDSENETIIVRLGGAPANALPDHESFDLSNQISVIRGEGNSSSLWVDEMEVCIIPGESDPTVVWAIGETTHDRIPGDGQQFFNLDGTEFIGDRGEIDILLYRYYNFTS
mgnify:CR=1 FL=1